MAFTAQQKQALATWLEANIHKAVHTTYWKEGIKDEDGKAVYGDCVQYFPNSNVPVPEAETYWGRTFIIRSEDRLDLDEVITRVRQKAIKHGYSPDEDDVRDLLRENAATIKTWLAPGVTISHGNSPLSRSAVEAEDPDV